MTERKKSIQYILGWTLLPVLLLLCVSCKETNGTAAKKNDVGKDVPAVVAQAPDGFVPLKETLTAGNLDFVCWETQVSVCDEYHCLYQTDIDNTDFLREYEGKYYGSEKILQEILNDATMFRKDAEKTYQVGDTFGIRRYGLDYDLIVTLEKICRSAPTEDNRITYTFEITTDPETAEYDLPSRFYSAESDKGNIYSEFSPVDTKHVSIQLPADEEPVSLILSGEAFTERKIALKPEDFLSE